METIGSLIDKINIIELKNYHMQEQIRRRDVDRIHIDKCIAKLHVLIQQRNDLIQELDDLFKSVISGEKEIKVYRQFKMYNDPKYRLPN